MLASAVILDTAPAGFEDVAPVDLARWPAILADRTLSTGRHIVLADTGGPHHLWLRETRPAMPLAYVVPRGAAANARSVATWRLDRRLSGIPPAACPRGFIPTAFQAQRLALLLAILDAVQNARTDRPTTHQIASTLVYPRLSLARGAAWKASSERRRTQRLIDEALGLMNGGYRALVAGQQPVRQKSRI